MTTVLTIFFLIIIVVVAIFHHHHRPGLEFFIFLPPANESVVIRLVVFVFSLYVV